jgi:DUF971 family protein
MYYFISSYFYAQTNIYKWTYLHILNYKHNYFWNNLI